MFYWTIVDNDADDDGVCDADEIAGCQDSTACNYNESATDSDGSCIYYLCINTDMLISNYRNSIFNLNILYQCCSILKTYCCNVRVLKVLAPLNLPIL